MSAFKTAYPNPNSYHISFLLSFVYVLISYKIYMEEQKSPYSPDSVVITQV